MYYDNQGDSLVSIRLLNVTKCSVFVGSCDQTLVEVEECITTPEVSICLIMHRGTRLRKDMRSLLSSYRGACKSGLMRAVKGLRYGKLIML